MGWREAVREQVEEATERYETYGAYPLRNALENAMLREHTAGRLHIEERVLLDVVFQRLRKLEKYES